MRATLPVQSLVVPAIFKRKLSQLTPSTQDGRRSGTPAKEGREGAAGPVAVPPHVTGAVSAGSSVADEGEDAFTASAGADIKTATVNRSVGNVHRLCRLALPFNSCPEKWLEPLRTLARYSDRCTNMTINSFYGDL
jgi:hypothetical protein